MPNILLLLHVCYTDVACILANGVLPKDLSMKIIELTMYSGWHHDIPHDITNALTEALHIQHVEQLIAPGQRKLISL